MFRMRIRNIVSFNGTMLVNFQIAFLGIWNLTPGYVRSCIDGNTWAKLGIVGFSRRVSNGNLQRTSIWYTVSLGKG